MGEFNFYYLFSFQGICNLGIIISIYTGIAIAAKQSELNDFYSDELLSEEHIQYYDVILQIKKNVNIFIYSGSLESCLLLSIIFSNSVNISCFSFDETYYNFYD